MSSEQKQECSSILSASVFGQVNNEIAIVPRQQEPKIISESSNNVQVLEPTVSSGSVDAGTSSMMAKFSEFFGQCTFQNCDIRFS